jgi:parallel beta-helix repeat protein
MQTRIRSYSSFRGLTPVLITLALAAGLWARAAQAATLLVANNGQDIAGCGSTFPCRSISQAILNATAGDTIVVGPGRYGDLNGDGIIGNFSGEELSPDPTCGCMILVNKSLTILSQDGAKTTLIDTGGAFINGALATAVRVTADGAVFGQIKGNTVQGFTTTGGFVGLWISSNGATGAGNLATGNQYGIVVTGTGSTVTGNTATANTNSGFFLSNNNTANANAATGNAVRGFELHDSSTATGNAATDNGHEGFGVFPVGTVTVTGNESIGNRGPGVFAGSGSSAIVTQNNLYGNNDPPFAFGTGTFTNCGLLNDSGGAITATNNFWGAATGPGPNPADNVCDVSGTTDFAPFATKPFAVKVQ